MKETRESWHPEMTEDTTKLSYWFNWRVLICFLWLLFAIISSLFMIFKYEGFGKKRGVNDEEEEEFGDKVYEDETWRPCLKGIHPAWLLAFRVVAFFVLLIMSIVIALVDGSTIFYYYTQWTFALITIYFGVYDLLFGRALPMGYGWSFGSVNRTDQPIFFGWLGSMLSLHGCYQYNKRATGKKVGIVELDSEPVRSKRSGTHEETNARKPAGFWGYIFQIIFQMNAGAVLLTDCVFWFIIVPFLAINDYSLNVLVINMHSINAIFLLGDAFLNCLRFPSFRIAYFFLWTVTFVLFQWILHASVHIWWPYPFLDLSSHYAPLWYLTVAVMHLPCYGAFALLIKLKHTVLQKWFPDSYQCLR